MLEDNTDEVILRDSGPTVRLRLDVSAAAVDADPRLDLGVEDDQIVAIALRIAAANSDARVVVFSDDTRPIAKARAVGVGFKFIPEAWRRPPEDDEAGKERKRLEDENRRLRAAEPVLEVDVVDAPSDRSLVVEFTSHTPLASEDVEQQLREIEAKHPPESTFDGAKAHLPRRVGPAGTLAGLGAGYITQHTFVPASHQAIEDYTDEAYPGWLARCRAALEEAHSLLDVQAPSLVLNFDLRSSAPGFAETPLKAY